ncbi:hypothetical protein B0J12DRAFT_651252 [Macrophomina phaseolina]|uniref:Rrn9 domain-containing protein n=1 Tax=Macrophomina phaseolina TaxID=35725 RepID=A0ABQ8GJW2_9PEZI|nr:hypothetical protein B0J12DRAFT_651252 [Macrophomina phaseolina]
MSLFGGPLQDETPFIRSSSIIPPSSPPLLPSDNPVSSIERNLAADREASDEYTDYESDDARPRFQGKWWTYRNYIQEERDLAASLAQLRAEDLSLHLYNAHALKQRARKERAVLQKNKADNSTGKPWTPPRLWTAWPLEPSQVPRSYERFAPLPTIDPDDECTVRREGYDREKPSRDMEDIMVGAVLKSAKERFHKRKWADESEADPEEAGRARSRSCKRSRATSQATDNDSDAGRRSRATSASRAATPTGSRPGITTDDDRAHRILQPSIRSTLTQIDNLFAALHRSQQNRFRSRAKNLGDDTDTAADTGADTDTTSIRSVKRTKRNPSVSEGEASVKRRRGRPPKPILQAAMAESTPDVTEAEPEAAGTSPRKGKRGRPRKYPKPLPGESWYMMKKRIDQLNTAGQHPDPPADSGNTGRARTTEPDPESSRPASPVKPRAAARSKRTRTGSMSSEGSENAEPKTPRWTRGDKAVRLRDWREVLGTAAMLGGFKPAVIDRAIRRCADLFGESMSLRVLEESNALEKPGELVEYVPETIPPREDAESDEEVDDAEEQESTPVWDGVSLKCPHSDCPRHTEAYNSRWRLREHVKKKHGYKLQAAGDEMTETEGETVASKVKVNHWDLVGAVHNDGFLQPIRRRPGWVLRERQKAVDGTSQPPPVVSTEPPSEEREKPAQKKKKGKRAPGF